ncbi:flagellar biosynthesis anti-sigma factor FlgM [Paraburkholderia sartisoli]|uniref:Negative regulator of flagellin synthesis n=1 Tax=Paraburkholderia sartisoli TaxID=83784 RepID=A0A1H4G4T5_9BURK|nr:flagellar biosynthesis anti-sigma factor FlgM [Paraburkholderia sartisoli]SEB04060.1 anti-sigma-28 factor, FlgM family [Paraburkholderia sartisoli]
MKVDSTSSSGLSTLKDAAQRTQQGGDAAPANAGAGATAASAAGSAAGSASGDASVSLSGLAAHLHSLAASGSADIDTANIESIRQGIKDGSLKIDTGKIADGVLETARSLLQQKSPSTGN